jgi:hypothetical protein
MTQAAKLKQVIRARARKTGESYSIARRQVLRLREKRAGRVPPGAAEPLPVQPANPRRTSRLGAVSDEASREKTGHGLEHWFQVLDEFGAAKKGHTAAARHLYERGVPDWYCQGITVAYERARGLRQVNQSCTGKFQVSVSRVVDAHVHDVVEALKSDARRAAWLRGADPELLRALRAAVLGPKGRTLAVREKGDARIRYKWDKSTIEIRIDPRPKQKSSVTAANIDLPTADLVEPRREAWKQALDGLRSQLAR